MTINFNLGCSCKPLGNNDQKSLCNVDKSWESENGPPANAKTLKKQGGRVTFSKRVLVCHVEIIFQNIIKLKIFSYTVVFLFCFFKKPTIWKTGIKFFTAWIIFKHSEKSGPMKGLAEAYGQWTGQPCIWFLEVPSGNGEPPSLPPPLADLC